MFTHRHLLSLVSAAAVLASASSQAATIHFILDTMDEVPITDSPWVVNSTRTYSVSEVVANETQTITGLKNIDGSEATGVWMTMTGFYVLGGYNQNTAVWNQGQSLGNFTPDMAADYIWNEGPGGVVTINGLDSSQKYTVNWLAARQPIQDSNETRWAFYTANGMAPDGMAAGEGFNAVYDGWNQTKILTWSNLSPDASGTITFGANGSNIVGQYAYLNALEIQTVPEPGSLALGALAAGFLFTGRRRK